MPLLKLGHATARFANPVDLSGTRAQAIYRLHEAITNEPLYIAGHGTVVSELNEVTKGAVLAKTGAEGIVTAALPERGLGIALKITDGSTRARSVAFYRIRFRRRAIPSSPLNFTRPRTRPSRFTI